MRLLTALLIAGYLTATGALAQSKTEMQHVLDDWAAAFNEDAGKVAMHYKSDATLSPPGNDVLQGGQNAAVPQTGSYFPGSTLSADIKVRTSGSDNALLSVNS